MLFLLRAYFCHDPCHVAAFCYVMLCDKRGDPNLGHSLNLGHI